MLDNNGFIIISEKPEHTGIFFGQADGTIMDSLVQDGIYKKVPVMDYQGACVDSKSNINAGYRLLVYICYSIGISFYNGNPKSKVSKGLGA